MPRYLARHFLCVTTSPTLENLLFVIREVRHECKGGRTGIAKGTEDRVSLAGKTFFPAGWQLFQRAMQIVIAAEIAASLECRDTQFSQAGVKFS